MVRSDGDLLCISSDFHLSLQSAARVEPTHKYRDRNISGVGVGSQGFSQESFADYCGLHRTYISGIERGVRNPTVIILDKIARALKVPAGTLLDEAKASVKKP